MTEELSRINSNMFIEDVNSLNKISLNNDNITSDDSDADNDILFTKARSKLKRVTNSDSDTDKENDFKRVDTVPSPQKSDSDHSNNGKVFSNKKRSRIKNISNSDSESLSGDDSKHVTSKYDLTRTKIRNKELHDKFKNLKHSKCIPNENTNQLSSTERSEGEDTEDSSDGAISYIKIKQKLKKKSSHTLTSICEPDISDEETNVNVKLPKSKPRSTKLTSPKAVRMSAKQAMENMQKIKSESNRMLREKEVSLPYHRPKALTLKDIMNRRKPALTLDGKSLPIKMNNEQLKQYALMLEQRQKEMMELCKSDTDEDEPNCLEEVPLTNAKDDKETCTNEATVNQEVNSSSDANDKSFDEINMEHNINKSIICKLNDQNIKETTAITESEGCEDSTVHNNQVNPEDDTKYVAQKQGQANEQSILCESHAICLNDSNKAASINTIEKEGQTMEVAFISKSNELHLTELNKGTDQESQIISLHYDSEKSVFTNNQDTIEIKANDEVKDNSVKNYSKANYELENKVTDEFSDDDFTMEELEEIIENAEVKGISNKLLPNIDVTLKQKPMLTGAPGMVIDLDNDSENTEKKLTGVELLKERFKYFARLKSLEEMEKDRGKKFKPGIQHLKLKQELEEQIAEQRSLEWEKRLQAENQLKNEMNEVEGEGFDGEDIEKIEAKLEGNDVVDEDEEECSTDEEIEDADDYNVKDKPRLRNPLIDDEAEVSEEEDVKVGDDDCNENGADDNGDVDNEDDDGENDSEEDDDEDSSQSEEDEQQTKFRKGRILKAFEDSDDENLDTDPVPSQSKSNEIRESQDDEIQSAQPLKTFSDDLFSSQECTQKISNRADETKVADTSLEDLGSQTFSILKSGAENIPDRMDVSAEKLDVICESQACSDDNFDAIVGMCTGGFSENLVTPQAESSQLFQSQEIGDDVALLCTGKFYDNPFVSHASAEVESNVENKIGDESLNESNSEKQDDVINMPEKVDSNPAKVNEGDNKLLKSILEELDDPEFDSPKSNKYFFNAVKNQDINNTESFENTQLKKKFVIESDDEMNEGADKVARKKKKTKKRKLENRALQISDDEEEYSEAEQETFDSDVEEDNNRLVEYDSEENEVEIQSKVPKKKRAGRDFFEQEAELTSEDEWIGSGDEDEAGLDRMEREEGDDDTFHQGKLQRELGEIHMREVLDQDKREVRLLQELLFEDGDLGDGHRQRKFRWKNADGEEELGTNADEYADTQEDEFESEEQWRKQRHEREVFLRKLQEKDEDANVSINRSAFIKATLAAKPTAGSLEKSPHAENNSSVENIKSPEWSEKKTVHSIPSPKKPFIILQQSYHNSLLTRGRGALARLAALATPLAGDGDDAPKVNASSSRGNFVFAAVTPTDTRSKATKRRADTAPDAPKLAKRMKQESSKISKSSLLDHL